ncbi:DUF1254 domain-containing protein [Rubritalea sp.]|uniref:DUF1254 domain-containing protein n=1 Tax=Rubritalea sp. TaxID=2109375 RepID=UPI003EF748EF
MKANTIAYTALAAVSLTFTGTAADISTTPSPAEIKTIAEEGFVYGLPIVMNYAVMYEYTVDKGGSQFKAPFNQLKNEPRVYTYKDTAVISPNSDTPYSFTWLDLRAEPVVLTVPKVEKNRYYAVMMCDSNTYNYGYIGSRATGNDPGNYMVVGPDWKGDKPDGIKEVFTSTTPFSLVAYRTQLFNPEDMPNVIKIQDGYQVKPLSVFLKQPAPETAPKIDFLPATTGGIKENFFQYLDAALELVPTTDENKDIHAKLASIGIGPGKTFDFKDLSPEHKAAFVEAMKVGDAQVSKYLADGTKKVNNWNIGAFFGDQEFFSGDWLKRAAGAKAGIYANDAIEATYPYTRVDGNGDTLDCSKSNYTLTFPAGEYPPVNAFWSVTMYDGKSQLLIENPINRYIINSPMMPNMKKNEDGSLTLYIQHESPGADKEANWLPAPNDTVYLAMRLYWPKTEAPSVLPPGDGSWKPPGIVKVK